MSNFETVQLAPGAVCLRDFATMSAQTLLDSIQTLSRSAPFRKVRTPSGKSMSVEMTNCGDCGWISDHRGYRYVKIDPITGVNWPPLPSGMARVAVEAAKSAGYSEFNPDVCLINRYAVGASMGLHQDRDEEDFAQPIVSVSLGLSVRFRMGGVSRGDKTQNIALHHGDVVVFGGPSRLAFHGVGRLGSGTHPMTGAFRFNLTFRRANHEKKTGN